MLSSQNAYNKHFVILGLNLSQKLHYYLKDSSTIKIPLNSKSVPILTGVPSSQNVGFLTATNLYPNVKNSPAKNISRTGFARLNTANTIEIVSKSQGGNTQTIFLSTAGKVRVCTLV